MGRWRHSEVDGQSHRAPSSHAAQPDLNGKARVGGRRRLAATVLISGIAVYFGALMLIHHVPADWLP